MCGMDEYTICVNCGSGIRNITKDECPFCGLSVTKRPNIILRIIGADKPKIRNTCERCKFWDGIDRKLIYGQCSNSEKGVVCTGEGHVYYPNDFGCIFWEGK